jgi:hypothetical protein
MIAGTSSDTGEGTCRCSEFASLFFPLHAPSAIPKKTIAIIIIIREPNRRHVIAIMAFGSPLFFLGSRTVLLGC